VTVFVWSRNCRRSIDQPTWTAHNRENGRHRMERCLHQKINSRYKRNRIWYTTESSCKEDWIAFCRKVILPSSSKLANEDIVIEIYWRQQSQLSKCGTCSETLKVNIDRSLNFGLKCFKFKRRMQRGILNDYPEVPQVKKSRETNDRRWECKDCICCEFCKDMSWHYLTSTLTSS